MDGGSYVRNCAPMVASPGVTYKDILAEVNSKTDGHLESVTIFVHWYLVSMTVKAFLDIAKNYHHEDDPEADFEGRKANLAKELIASRDFNLNGGYERKDHKQWDYWPKD